MALVPCRRWPISPPPRLPAPLPASREQLASVLDARLTEIWAELFQVPRERWDHELIGWFLRAAYGQGYCDALREPAGGSLTRELGYDPQ